MGKMHEKLKLKQGLDLDVFAALKDESQFDEVTEAEFTALVQRFTPVQRSNGMVRVETKYRPRTGIMDEKVPECAVVKLTMVPPRGVHPITVVIAEAEDMAGEYKFFLKYGVEKLWKPKK
jgi:hypothetical protein